MSVQDEAPVKTTELPKEEAGSTTVKDSAVSSKDIPHHDESSDPEGSGDTPNRPTRYERRVFFSNLPPNYTANDIRELFKDVGRPQIHLPRRQGPRRTLYGYATFASKEIASEAVASLNNKTVSGHEVKMMLADPPSATSSTEPETGEPKSPKSPKSPRSPAKRVPREDRPLTEDTVFVPHLPTSTTEGDLRELFKDYPISDVRIFFKGHRSSGPDSNRRARSSYKFAFVVVGDAAGAVAKLNGTRFLDTDLVVKISTAPPVPVGEKSSPKSESPASEASPQQDVAA